MTSAAPLAGAAQDAAHTPEAGIGQTAAASQPITTTGILTGVVLPAVDLPLSATGVVTWNVSAPDAAVSLPAPLLTMSADPFQIVPGGVITYSVAITNVAGAPLARVALDSPLPTGMAYVAQSGVGFSYSPRDQRLSWAIERIEPGRGLRGSFQLRATGLGIGQLITNTVSAASADAPLVTASAVVEVAPPRQNRVWATPGEGGWLRSEDGRVDLRAPAGAMPRRTELRYTAQASQGLPPDVLVAFDLDAVDEQGQAIYQFTAPLRIAVPLRALGLTAPQAAGHTLATFDRASQRWTALATTIDPERQQLLTTVEHFSTFGVISVDSAPIPAQGDRMSIVRGAQASLFTRSIVYGQAIDLPPGRGGLAPALGLNYNSANHSQHQGHLSYVGHGWSLAGADSIFRDPNSISEYDHYLNGNVTMSLQGRTYTLQRYQGSDGQWRFFAKEDPLLKIDYSQQYTVYGGVRSFEFKVRTREGLVFTYRGTVDYPGGNSITITTPMEFVWGGNPIDANWRHLYWTRLLLIKVEDLSGNTIDYSWMYESCSGECTPTAGGKTYGPLGSPGYVRAIRLSSISYNGGRTSVEFAYNGRIDRPNLADDTQFMKEHFSFYTTQKLHQIVVKVLREGMSSADTVRTVKLEHAPQGSGAASQIPLLLAAIVELSGVDQANVADRVSFGYFQLNYALNRLKGKTYSTGAADCPADPGSYNVSYSYDAGPNGKGQRTGMVDPSGSTAWEYDVRGRMTKETKVISGTGGGTFVTQWTVYDSMDRVRTMIYPDGESVTFSYTSQGPLKKVEGTSTYVGETLYSALGQVTDRYLGSTAGLIRQKYTYTQAENFRLTALQSGVASAYNNLQNLSYSYDAVGNVKSIVDVVNSNQRQCYNYDALHRLTRGFTTDSATCASANLAIGSGPFDESTTYQDALGGRGGNLTSKTGVGNYSYGVAQAADCPEGALVKANAVVAAGSNYLTYCYDQNGNLRRRKVGASTTTYSYDAENRLTGVSGAATATFVYDSDGNRVKTTFGATTTVYVGAIYERDNDSTVRKYYYAGGVRIATPALAPKRSAGASVRSGGQTYYLLGDHLGGTNVTANSSGVQLSKLLYKPWGETRFSTGTTPTTWRFTGQREDATIGLYYFNARYLDPVLGRFTQPDTIVLEPGDPQAPSTNAGAPRMHELRRVTFVHSWTHSWTAAPTPLCRSRAIHRR